MTATKTKYPEGTRVTVVGKLPLPPIGEPMELDALGGVRTDAVSHNGVWHHACLFHGITQEPTCDWCAEHNRTTTEDTVTREFLHAV